MAGGAILRIEGGAAGGIRQRPRRERHRIGGDQLGTEAMGEPLDLSRRGPAGDGGLERVGAGDQARLCRLRWQRGDPLTHRRGEFGHFLIFAGAEHASVPNRARIVDGEIIEEPPARLHVLLLRRRGPGSAEGEQEKGEEREPALEHGGGLNGNANDYQ